MEMVKLTLSNSGIIKNGSFDTDLLHKKITLILPTRTCIGIVTEVYEEILIVQIKAYGPQSHVIIDIDDVVNGNVSIFNLVTNKGES